jgi:hypothetical protein
LHNHCVCADHHDVAGAEFLCGLHKTVLYEISSFNLCSTAYGASGFGALLAARRAAEAARRVASESSVAGLPRGAAGARQTRGLCHSQQSVTCFLPGAGVYTSGADRNIRPFFDIPPITL